MVYSIIGVTVFFYLLQLISEWVFSIDLPIAYGARINEAILAGELWRLLTPVLLHASPMHIAFNMYALWALGTMLEDAMGRMRFFVLYMASLLAGSAGVLIAGGNGITGGASGAVFGLFGAAAVGLYRRGVNPLQTSIGTVLILNLVLTFAIPNISVGGHLGGLIGGAICGYAMFAPPWKRVPTWVVWATPAAVIVVSVLVSFAVSS
jgi:membrane associated rhomboid family serine protease